MNISFHQQLYNSLLDLSNEIYGNYSNLRNFIYKDSNTSIYEFSKLINSNQGCEILVQEENYSYYLKKICYYEPILINQFGNLLAGYINELRSSLNSFFFC